MESVNRPAPPSPAWAYWNQRFAVAKSSARLCALRTAIACVTDLPPPVPSQWFAYAREYRPDLIVELGRGKGNSTAALAEALYQNQSGKLTSLCLTGYWNQESEAALRPLVESDWFTRLDIRVEDICRADFHSVVAGARRVLVVWDAHGFAIAEAVLGRLMPLLQDREHMVIMHDISDRRYCGSRLEYGEAGLWQGTEWAYRTGRTDSRVFLGWIDTLVEQAIAVADFLTRNRTELRSADHSYHQEIVTDPVRQREMAALLSPDDWNPLGHWAYFSLNGVPEPHTFPKIRTPLVH